MTDAYTDEATRLRRIQNATPRYTLAVNEKELQLILEAVHVYDDLWEKRELECEEDIGEIRPIRDVAKEVLARLELLKNRIKEKKG